MVLIQPYKSGKANVYHTILLLIMAVYCYLITLLDEAEIKAHWMIRYVVLVTEFSFMAPIFVMAAYISYCVAYRLHKKCQEVCLIHRQRNYEQQNMANEEISENCKNYQTINITE